MGDEFPAAAFARAFAAVKEFRVYWSGVGEGIGPGRSLQAGGLTIMCFLWSKGPNWPNRGATLRGARVIPSEEAAKSRVIVVNPGRNQVGSEWIKLDPTESKLLFGVGGRQKSNEAWKCGGDVLAANPGSNRDLRWAPMDANWGIGQDRRRIQSNRS